MIAVSGRGRSFSAAAVVLPIAVSVFLLPMSRPRSQPAAPPPTSPAPTPARAVDRRAGPAGSLLLVESSHAIPIVYVAAALRSGSSSDPRHKDGLAHLAANVARHGAAGRGRAELDAALDALGAELEVHTEPDSVRFEGHVLARQLDAYLGLLAQILLKPDFTAAEVEHTRAELGAELDEMRNEDQALCGRFFVRNLYSDHPYGHPSEGTQAGLARVTARELAEFFRRQVVGPNLILAASGDVEPGDFAARVQRLFAGLPATAAPGPPPLAVRDPVPPSGWRIQLVDKPARQQAQLMFGQIGVRATDPDYLPLMVAVTSFGGQGMKATLMDEVRTKRGLAYGAYMNLTERIGRGAVVGWAFSAAEKLPATLKLVLRLYTALAEKGIPDERLAFAKSFLAGSYTAEMDDPVLRLDARVDAEVVGLPPAFVDELPARVQAVTAAEVRAAVARHVRARDLAITIVATAADVHDRLISAKIPKSAIDVVPYDSY